MSQVQYHEALQADRKRGVVSRLSATVYNVIDEMGGGPTPSLVTRAVAEKALYEVLREFRPDLFIDRPAFGKYGTPEGLADKLLPGEPFFAILGRDENAVATLLDYTRHLSDADQHEQAEDMRQNVIVAFDAWQRENPDKVKQPT